MSELDLKELRGQIDGIDRQIVELYRERRDCSLKIGAWKRERGLPVLDTERERELLNRVGDLAGEENASEVRALFSLLMARSRSRQHPPRRLLRRTGIIPHRPQLPPPREEKPR